MKKRGVWIAAIAAALMLTAGLFVGCKDVKKISAGVPAPISEAERLAQGTTAERAQYMPEAEQIVGNRSGAALATAEGDAADPMDVFAFEKKLGEIAYIDSPGAGKYLGYEIPELKIEMINTVLRAPYADAWFRFPHDGGTYGGQASLVEKTARELRVSRICWRTRASRYDAATDTEIEDYPDRQSTTQFNMIRVRFFTDDMGREVVETEMYDVMDDRGVFVPVQYQMIRNVENSSFIKYRISVSPRTLLGYATDIGLPYGAEREFVYLDYDQAAHYNLLEVEQRFPSVYNAGGFGGNGGKFGLRAQGADIRLTRKAADGIGNAELTYVYDGTEPTKIVNRAVGVSGTAAAGALSTVLGAMASLMDAPAEATPDILAIGGGDVLSGNGALERDLESALGKIAANFCESFTLKNDWEKIFYASEAAETKVGEVVDLPVYLKNLYAHIYLDSLGRARLEIDSYLPGNPRWRDITAFPYRLKAAAKDESGAVWVLPQVVAADDFAAKFDGYDPYWYGIWLETKNYDSYDFGNFALLPAGRYALGIALVDEEDRIVDGNFRLLESPYKDADVLDAGYRVRTQYGCAILEVYR